MSRATTTTTIMNSLHDGVLEFEVSSESADLDLATAYRIEDTIQSMNPQQPLESAYLSVLEKELDAEAINENALQVLGTLTRALRFCGVKRLYLRIGSRQLFPYIVELIMVATESIQFDLWAYPLQFNDSDVVRLLSAVRDSPRYQILRISFLDAEDSLIETIQRQESSRGIKFVFTSDSSSCEDSDASPFYDFWTRESAQETPKDAANLLSLPDEVKKKILIYISSPFDFLACERTCCKLHEILQDDDLWEHCRHPRMKVDDRLSHRENAFVSFTLRKIQKWQRGSDSIVLDAFGGPNEFRKFIHDVATLSIGFCPNCFPKVFVLRGDSLGLIVALLQDFMVKRIERAHMVTADVALWTRADSYPVLECKHLDLVERLGAEVALQPTMDALILHMATPDTFDKLIRRCAYVAGAVKLADEVFYRLGFEFIAACGLLMRQAVLEHTSYRFPPVLDPEAPIDMHNAVPFTKPIRSDDLTEGEEWMEDRLECIIIPRHIEMAARQLGDMPKVYSLWIASPDKKVEEEIARADARYRIFPKKTNALESALSDDTSCDESSGAFFYDEDIESLSETEWSSSNEEGAE